MNEFNYIPPEISDIHDLYLRAIESYNQHWLAQGEDFKVLPKDFLLYAISPEDKDFLDRIAKNFLKANCAEYHRVKGESEFSERVLVKMSMNRQVEEFLYDLKMQHSF